MKHEVTTKKADVRRSTHYTARGQLNGSAYVERAIHMLTQPDKAVSISQCSAAATAGGLKNIKAFLTIATNRAIMRRPEGSAKEEG